jgi:dephospho-CoA kinase
MGKYLITGRPGSGKTTVINELKRRGFQAYNTDDMPDVTRLEEQTTGKAVRWPDGPVDWDRFIWNWQDEGIRNLLFTDGDVFIGAIVGNQQMYYSLFDKVFALTLTTETLANRLNTHSHPRTPAEKERALNLHNTKQERFQEQGLILISSEHPVAEIVDRILTEL